MGLIKKFINQTRKPEGSLGKLMLKGMNKGHKKMALFGLSTLPKDDFKNIAEIGCGGGANIKRLLRTYPNSFVDAIDYSKLSVEKSLKYNKKNLNRCSVTQDDVSNLHLDINKYDLATAFETVYFWPNLEKSFKNVCDILKKDGYFLIVNELDGLKESQYKYEKMIEGMKVYKANDLKDILIKVGFSDISITKNEKKGWFAILTKK